MNNLNMISIMQQCRAEIVELRNEVSILRPKAEAFEAMQDVLGLLPRKSQAMKEDVVYMLEGRIESCLKEERHANGE